MRLMGLIACLAAVLSLAGCVSPSSSREDAARQEWKCVCQRMHAGAHISTADPLAQPSPGQRDSLVTAARKAAACIVHIRAYRTASLPPEKPGDGMRETTSESGGTGVIIDPSGLVLTNEHVIRNSRQLLVLLPDGSEQRVECFAIDSHYDLALLRIHRDGLMAIRPATDGAQTAQSPVIAVGWPDAGAAQLDRPGIVTRPSVSLQNELDPSRRRDYGQLIESTAGVEPGFSGGPLLDTEGRLVGLTVAASGLARTRPTRAYAIPFDAKVRRAVADLRRLVEVIPDATAVDQPLARR